MSRTFSCRRRGLEAEMRSAERGAETVEAGGKKEGFGNAECDWVARTREDGLLLGCG